MRRKEADVPPFRIKVVDLDLCHENLKDGPEDVIESGWRAGRRRLGSEVLPHVCTHPGWEGGGAQGQQHQLLDDLLTSAH